MKKLLITLLFCLTMFVSNAQETFVRKYTSMVTQRESVFGEWEACDLTVVFNYKQNRDVVFYYSNGNKKVFHQVSGVKTDKTKGGQEYQLINVIDSDDGVSLVIQLFDKDDTLRVIIASGYTIEFTNN